MFFLFSGVRGDDIYDWDTSIPIICFCSDNLYEHVSSVDVASSRDLSCQNKTHDDAFLYFVVSEDLFMLFIVILHMMSHY